MQDTRDAFEVRCCHRVAARSAWALACVGLWGCAALTPTVKATEQTALMAKLGTQMPAREMRTRIDALVPPLLSSIEQLSDQVRNASTDPAVQREALLLQLDAVPVVYRAAYQHDPGAAALDLWLFTYQLENCLAAGHEPCAFGEQQRVALTSGQQLRKGLEDEYRRVARDPSDLDALGRRIEGIASAHPLAGAGALAARYTITVEAARVLGMQSRNALSVVGDAEATLEDLGYRLNTYIGDAPKLARWQMELALDDASDHSELARAFRDLHRLTNSLAQALDPATLHELMGLSFAEIQKESKLVLETEERERSIVLQDLSAERGAVLDALAAERRTILAQLRQERVETVANVSEIAHRTVVETSAEAFRVIDHVFWRLAQLLAGALVVVALLGWLALRFGHLPEGQHAQPRLRDHERRDV